MRNASFFFYRNNANAKCGFSIFLIAYTKKSGEQASKNLKKKKKKMKSQAIRAIFWDKLFFYYYYNYLALLWLKGHSLFYSFARYWKSIWLCFRFWRVLILAQTSFKRWKHVIVMGRVMSVIMGFSQKVFLWNAAFSRLSDFVSVVSLRYWGACKFQSGTMRTSVALGLEMLRKNWVF